MASKARLEDDDVHDALLPESSSSPWTAASERFGAMLGAVAQRRIGLNGGIDPSEAYNGETQDALDQKLRSLDSKAHRNRLRGWYSYAFASEVFAVCSLTLFLPICLEQFARDNGYLLPDKFERCVRGPDPDSLAITEVPGEEARCVVKIGWLWIDSASFSLYVYSFSVLLQALVVISFGGVADRPSHRKLLLLAFAFLGSTSTICFLFLPSSSPVWQLCVVLAILAIVSFGASIVAMNAYLPSLARSAQDVRDKAIIVERLREAGPIPEADGNPAPDSDAYGSFGFSSDSHRQPRGEAQETGANDPHLEHALQAYNTALSHATSKISSRGIALGYSAGILLLFVALIPVTVMEGSTFSLRLAVSLSGMWWAVFSIPTAMWLPAGRAVNSGGLRWERHATYASGTVDLRDVREGSDDDDLMEHDPTILSQIGEAWIRLGQMLSPREMRKLRNTFWYLAAWFLLSDAFTTITSTAVLFAKTTLLLPPKALIVVGLLTPMAGIVGSLLWPRLQRMLRFSNQGILLTLILLASFVPLYGCLGFLPIFKGKPIGGLVTAHELYVLAVYFGSLYGAFQAYARAVFAELIPVGEEARWYGLFSITDKSSSFLGPLIVGLIADATGNIRYAFFFLLFMMLAACLPLLVVNVPQGRKDAEAYSQAD